MIDTILYPEIEPNQTLYLEVDSVHRVYVEESGNPEGIPVVFVHGGPGGGTSAIHRQYFNPQKYRIILFDQRGCGKSRPHAELENNTTWHLVEDIERIRLHFGIDKWAIFGGSWGSTLALAYAQEHADRCTALFLRGIFTLRDRELKWYYQDGCNRYYPDSWEQFANHIPVSERHDFISAYYRRLTSLDKGVRLAAAKCWSTWEGSNSQLEPEQQFTASYGEDSFALAFARIECHYFINKGFFSSDSFLLDRASTYNHLPGVIVQGRYDMPCPPETAWLLHKRWPKARFRLLNRAGHTASERDITRELVQATNDFANGILT